LASGESVTVRAWERKDRGYIEYSIVGTYPDGTEYGRYPNGEPRKRKSHLTTVTATVRWAENKEKEMQREWEENRAEGFKAPTWKEAREDYMEHSRAKRNSEGTLEWKKYMLQSINRFIEDETRIDKITDKQVVALMNGIKGKEKSINNVLDVFLGVLRLQQRKKRLVHLPLIEKVKVPESAPKYLRTEEYDRYLDAARELERAGHWQPLALGLLGAGSGLRRGEMLALHWKSIDFERLTIRVEYSYYKKKIVPTKGKRFRVVGMNEETAKLLKRNRHLRGALVFYTSRGVPATPRAVNLWFEMACTKAKLSPSGKLHVLRHTFGSHHAEAGTDLHRLQQLLGHADQRTTEIYARLAAHAALEATERLEAYRKKSRAARQVKT
jgi:integrase